MYSLTATQVTYSLEAIEFRMHRASKLTQEDAAKFLKALEQGEPEPWSKHKLVGNGGSRELYLSPQKLKLLHGDWQIAGLALIGPSATSPAMLSLVKSSGDSMCRLVGPLVDDLYQKLKGADSNDKLELLAMPQVAKAMRTEVLSSTSS